MTELTRELIDAAMREIADEGPRTATVHHPKCPSLETGRVSDCSCGGYMFPVAGPKKP